MGEEEVYIGTKIVTAVPMSEQQFATDVRNITNWEEGKPNRPGYQVRYEDGYVSWSPKETFERAYRKVTEAEKAMIL